MIRWLALACAIGVGSLGNGGDAELVLRVESAGRVVWSAPIAPGEPFDIAFEHSSERCTWTQHYEAGTDARIHQRSSSFPCYGAGMPAVLRAGERLRQSPQGLTMPAPLSIDALEMMNSRRASLRLIAGGVEVPIGAMLDDFERFTVRVAR